MRNKPTLLLGIIILIASTSLFAGECGDVNVSGTVNILDVSYLINFLYKHGPEPDCGTVTDVDGNVYQTVTIGNQVWMAENLQVTHYRNGEAISNVADQTTWDALSSGAYCNYNNDEGYAGTYGRLYNWYAVSDIRNIALAGWHVPSDAEWKQLEMSLGMSQADVDNYNEYRGTDEGGKIKESGTTHWSSPNTGATNASGFTALPSGGRSGGYVGMGLSAFFWSSTESASVSAWDRRLSCNFAGIGRYDYSNKKYGFSIRCVKD